MVKTALNSMEYHHAPLSSPTSEILVSNEDVSKQSYPHRNIRIFERFLTYEILREFCTYRSQDQVVQKNPRVKYFQQKQKLIDLHQEQIED